MKIHVFLWHQMVNCLATISDEFQCINRYTLKFKEINYEKKLFVYM